MDQMDDPLALVFGIMINPTKETIAESTIPMIEYLLRRNQPFVVEDSLGTLLRVHGIDVGDSRIAPRERVAATASVIIVYGGDGTLLAVAQYSLQYDVPLLGVNLGKLGFLADINPDNVIDAIERILDDQYCVEKRMMLRGAIDGIPGEFDALNDIVVSKSGTTRVIEIDASIDGEYLASFFADGFIVSTPTGSTAYSLATGGPIVVPGGEVIVLSPISAHTLTARPIIIPCTSLITLHVRSNEGLAMVMADGQFVAENLATMKLHIHKSQKSVQLVKGTGPSYFTMLREKLHWASDARGPRVPGSR